MVTLLLAAGLLTSVRKEPVAPVLQDATAPDARAPLGTPAADPQLRALLKLAQSSAPYARLTLLCDQVGNRLSGSAHLDDAIAWAKAGFERDGLKPWTEPVMVPVWIRGDERLDLLAPRDRTLNLLGLGGTVGAVDLEAPVVVVNSLDELGPQAKDRIVLVNIRMADGVPAGKRYGEAVVGRSQGASRAAAFGAKAVLVRSVTTRSLATPHTGALRYDPEQPKIPAAAITPEDADQIARWVALGVEVRVRLNLGASTAPDAPSANVIAEIRGAEHPDEIVLIGAHLDSWDVGQGAHDDGAGVVHVMEAMAALQRLDQAPKRTIRAVLFTNEENGLRGGVGYYEAHKGETHVAAVESDIGGGDAQVFRGAGTAADLAWLRTAAAPIGLPVTEGGGGADISPFGQQDVLLIGLGVDDSRYFDVHHTQADTIDKVDPQDLAHGAAALAGLAWQLANTPR